MTGVEMLPAEFLRRKAVVYIRQSTQAQVQAHTESTRRQYELVDLARREVVLVIHWKGGQHSELRVRRRKSGEHGCRTSEEAMVVIRSMATRWADEDIAASLNRMGMRTGQRKTWTAHRVGSLRRVHGIHAYRSAEKDGQWLTLTEAAAMLGVSSYQVRRLIKDGILIADQVVPDAPYQISVSDVQGERVATALAARKGPCRSNQQTERSCQPPRLSGQVG